MAVLIFSGVFGIDLYKTEIIFGINIESLLIFFNIVVGFFIGGSMILWNTFTNCKSKLDALMTLLPTIVMDVSILLWCANPMIESYAPLIFLIHGVIFSAICSKLIICSVAKQHFQWFDLCYFVELALLLELTFVKILPSYTALFAFCLYVLITYSVFVYDVVSQLSKYLGISVFKVKSKPQ